MTRLPNRLSSSSMRWIAASGFFLALAGVSNSASAYSFDNLGNLSFEPNAVFTDSFDVDISDPYAKQVQGDALEGKNYLHIESDQNGGVRLPISATLSNHAYRIRTFVRTNYSWIAYLSVYYTKGSGPPFAHAALSPTGRMTSDGWVELESPPLSIDASRDPAVELTMSSPSLDLDALEFVEDKSAYRATAQCSGVDISTCLDGQACIMGHCQDASAMVAPLPDQADRNLLVDVIKRKLEIFFGGVYTRRVPPRKNG